MKAPFFSIIIPVYDVEDYIQRCLESLYRQKLDESLYELIVIDDGTTDGSMQIVGEFAKKHSNIVVLTKANGGVSAARNDGMGIARGQYLLFVDPDDAIAANSLDAMLGELTMGPDILILRSSLYSASPDDFIELYPFTKSLCGRVFSGEELFKRYTRGSVCGVAFARSFVIEKQILFETSMRTFEDALFFGEALVYAERIQLTGIDYYKVHARSESASRLWDMDKVFSSLSGVQRMVQRRNQPDASVLKKSVLTLLVYQNISALTTCVMRMPGGLRHLLRVNTLIKQNACTPLSLDGVPRHRAGMRLLNLSWYLLVGAFCVRNVLRLPKR